MSSKKLEVAHGSGTLIRDVGHKHAEFEQLKSILTAEIIKALDRKRLCLHAAQARNEIAEPMPKICSTSV